MLTSGRSSDHFFGEIDSIYISNIKLPPHRFRIQNDYSDILKLYQYNKIYQNWLLYSDMEIGKLLNSDGFSILIPTISITLHSYKKV
jgi:hypothetical protein